MNQGKSLHSRRTALKSIGAAIGVSGLAGCSDQSDGGDGSDGSDGSGDGGGMTTSSGEWPDLSNTGLHIVIDEQATAVKELWNRITSDFTEATNADVELEFVGVNQGGVERVIQLLQAGDPPELFAFNPVNGTRFHTNGVLEPVTDVLEDTILPRLGDDLVVEPLTIDGEKWMVPLQASAGSWFWRGDLAEEVGMDRAPDWTWESVIEYARGVDELDNDVRGAYIPAGSGHHIGWNLDNWLRTAGGSYVQWQNDRVTVAFGEGEGRERMIETLEFLNTMHQYSPPATDSGWGALITAIHTGTASSNFFQGFRPKIQAIENDVPFKADVKCGPLPENRSRGGTTTLDGFGTFRGSNVDAAKTFLDFFSRPEYLIDAWTVTPVQNIPPYNSLIDSEEYQSVINNLPDGYTEDDVERYFESARLGTGNTEMTDPPNPYVSQIYTSAAVSDMYQAVILDDANPDDIIDQYAQELQGSLDEVQ